MNKLQELYNDKEMLEQLVNLLDASLKDLAIERTFNRESVEHLADAKEVIDNAFQALTDMYDKPKKEVFTDNAE